MSQPISKLSKPKSLRGDAEAVIDRLIEAGHTAYLAGGCVRDRLLGIEPKDFDIATDAPSERIRKLFPQTQAVGAAFGVVLVHFGKSTIEVATFRTDGNYLDGRHPASVTFSTPQEDARRRDFTINGLFFDVREQRVIDFVGGVADLTARRLRAIGQPLERFAEDHLRLLRAVRFAARFNLSIEPLTAEAINSLSPKLISVSPERIAEELRMMSAPPTRRHAWQLLSDFRLDNVIFRFAPPPSRQPQRLTILDDEPAALPLVLAAAILSRHEITELSEKMVAHYRQALRQALRWSNVEGDTFHELLHWMLPAMTGSIYSLARKRRWAATATFADSQRLLTASAAADNAPRLLELRDELSALTRTANPRPLIDGQDLQSIGLRPGPAFRRLLHETYDAQLEDRVTTRDQALSYAQMLASLSPPATG